MKGHQLIFTSCRCGITGVNDGQQIFSYDQGFPTSAISLLNPYFTYRGPDLPVGVQMTEDLVAGFPQSFQFNRLESGLLDFALNTYLGKDYMGPTGRYGNFLSHHLLFEEIPVYPAELYGSAYFRSSMPFEDVNNPEQPDFLPEIDIQDHESNSIEDIQAFLQVGDRIDIYKKMLACLLDFKASEKRIIINDSQNKVIKWIAALQYALTLKQAMNINFATYLYNPLEGSWRIAGAVDQGTMFQNTSNAYVFDIPGNSIPTIEVEHPFISFLEIGFLISPESLQDFHNFLDSWFPSYQTADEDLYGAYAAYEILSTEFEYNSLKPAIEFVAKKGDVGQRRRLIEQLYKQPSAVNSFVDVHTSAFVFGLFNSLAQDATALLDLTFDAEGHILDYKTGNATTDSEIDAVVAALWSNLNDQVLRNYSHQKHTVYQEFYQDQRFAQIDSLFKSSLAGDVDSKREFDELYLLLDDVEHRESIIETYHAYATSFSDRQHLLSVFVRDNINAPYAADLVKEALSGIPFNDRAPQYSAQLSDIWQWAQTNKLRIEDCGRLWSLISGLALTQVRRYEDFGEAVSWITKVADFVSVQRTPQSPAYLEWVFPAIYNFCQTGAELYQVLNNLQIRMSPDLVLQLIAKAIHPYSKQDWFKVAECIFISNSAGALADLSEACKKIAMRDIENLNKVVSARYLNNPEFLEKWRVIYEARQDTPFRKFTGLIGRDSKKDDDETRPKKHRGK
jgi:hypothetical protein